MFYMDSVLPYLILVEEKEIRKINIGEKEIHGLVEFRSYKLNWFCELLENNILYKPN